MKESPIIEKFIASCEKLDASILEPYLDENVILNGLDKYNFLEFLHRLFAKARKDELMKLVMVKKYCLSCHPNKEILEFYSKETKVEYYRYLPSRKIIKPVFAFAIINDSINQFDVEPCTQSWGNSAKKRYVDLMNLRKRITGNLRN
ncbi:hypothetical protein [Sediminicola arcticus]|uniref:Uncharacterized protein n=1 Tax=Sediminicola arcticus TaxID=1574308 RepID=A0ABV2SPU0_9FLAO